LLNAKTAPAAFPRYLSPFLPFFQGKSTLFLPFFQDYSARFCRFSIFGSNTHFDYWEHLDTFAKSKIHYGTADYRTGNQAGTGYRAQKSGSGQ
jgi:hypothetical protein